MAYASKPGQGHLRPASPGQPLPSYPHFAKLTSRIICTYIRIVYHASSTGGAAALTRDGAKKAGARSTVAADAKTEDEEQCLNDRGGMSGRFGWEWRGVVRQELKQGKLACEGQAR
jgi:hypothetical protein